MAQALSEQQFFGTAPVGRILLKIAPPVMLAQLIQALYNIVDSLFVGRCSQEGLTALAIINPLQLLMIAFAVGTGVGINTAMAARMGSGERREAEEYAGVGTPLALALWVVFALVCWCILPFYAEISTDSPTIARDVVVYGRIVCLLSVGLFLESAWTKILQAKGDMKTPMYAQLAGAAVNIILDPLLIFGLFGLPELGIAGAAIATAAGQWAAALVVFRGGWHPRPLWGKFPKYLRRIFALGVPNILMQSAYTFYILGLNLILAGFSDQAVTALGLYYKWQTFFFIPMSAMETCIVPVISFNYAAGKFDRCRGMLNTAIFWSMGLMVVAVGAYSIFPEPLLRVFASDEQVVAIGIVGFRIVSLCFLPQVTALIYPVFFQAVGDGLKSSLLTVVRTVFLYVPLGFVFARFGLTAFWFAFPVTEVVTSLVGYYFYRQFVRTHLPAP